MIKSLFIVALLAAPTTETAPSCITTRQIGDAAMMLAPIAIDAIREKCQPHLASDAFLVRSGAELVTRLKAESAGREATAAEVLLATMGDDVPQVKDKQALVQSVGAIVSGTMVKELQPDRCGHVNGMIEALAPMPAENLGMFIASFVGLMESDSKPAKAKKGKGLDAMTICKDG